VGATPLSIALGVYSHPVLVFTNGNGHRLGLVVKESDTEGKKSAWKETKGLDDKAR